MNILEQHDAHVALYVAIRQQVRWVHGVPVCFDCGGFGFGAWNENGKIKTAPIPLWTAFDDNGTPRRVCPDCYRKAYAP